MKTQNKKLLALAIVMALAVATIAATFTASYLEVAEVATPSTPASGFIRFYGKSDNLLYMVDDAGTEKGVVTQGDTIATTTATIGTGIVTNNIRALLTVGDTTFVDLLKASQTNAINTAITFAHASNGVAGAEMTHVRWFVGDDDTDYALTIPATWMTNSFSEVPDNITNNMVTRMIVTGWGESSSAALQSNVFVSFEYFKQ